MTYLQLAALVAAHEGEVCVYARDIGLVRADKEDLLRMLRFRSDRNKQTRLVPLYKNGELRLREVHHDCDE